MCAEMCAGLCTGMPVPLREKHDLRGRAREHVYANTRARAGAGTDEHAGVHVHRNRQAPRFATAGRYGVAMAEVATHSAATRPARALSRPASRSKRVGRWQKKKVRRERAISPTRMTEQLYTRQPGRIKPLPRFGSIDPSGGRQPCWLRCRRGCQNSHRAIHT